MHLERNGYSVHVALYPFKFLDILGDRLRIYELNGMPIHKVIEYFNTGLHHTGIDANFLGYELQYELYDKLRGLSPRLEVPIMNTKIDVLADGQAYECKASTHLNSKCVRQVQQYSTRYNAHVYTLADTEVMPDILAQIKKAGADVVRSQLNKHGLIERVLNMQKLLGA